MWNLSFGLKISANEFESSLIVFLDLKNLFLDTKHNEIWQNLKILIFDPYASIQKRAWPKKQVPLSAWTVNFFLWYPETLNYHLEQEINCRNFVHGMANFVQKNRWIIKRCTLYCEFSNHISWFIVILGMNIVKS